MNNQLISLSRLSRLCYINLRRNMLEHILCGALIFIITLFFAITSNSVEDYQLIIIHVSLIIGVIYVSLENRNMHSKSNRMHFVTQPYSSFEKFLSGVCMRILLMTIFYGVAIGFIDIFRNTLWNIFYPIEINNILSMNDEFTFFKDHILVLPLFLSITAIGTTAFKRNALLINMIIGFGTYIIIALRVILMEQMTKQIFAQNGLTKTSIHSGLDFPTNIFIDYAYVLPIIAVCLIISLYKIKEVEA